MISVRKVYWYTHVVLPSTTHPQTLTKEKQLQFLSYLQHEFLRSLTETVPSDGVLQNLSEEGVKSLVQLGVILGIDCISNQRYLVRDIVRPSSFVIQPGQVDSKVGIIE